MILKNIKEVVRNSVCHTATVIANSFMHAGTTSDQFLRDNLEWLARATNWSKFTGEERASLRLHTYSGQTRRFRPRFIGMAYQPPKRIQKLDGGATLIQVGKPKNAGKKGAVHCTRVHLVQDDKVVLICRPVLWPHHGRRLFVLLPGSAS